MECIDKLRIQKGSFITKFFTTVFYASLIYLLYAIFLTKTLSLPFDFYILLLALTLIGGIGFVLPIGGENRLDRSGHPAE